MKFDASIIKTDSVTVVVDGVPYTVDSSNTYFEQLKVSVLKNEPKVFMKYFDMSKTIAAKMTTQSSKVTIENGEVYYNGQALHNEITRRILEYLNLNYSFQSLVKFLENLMQNPSMRSVNELYNFLEHKNIPITEDGHFLAYKGVTDDYKDCHSQTFDNKVGSKHSIERNQVDDDCNVGCSYGFHVGSLEYASPFGARTMIVKVNPKDAVSVPLDSSQQKLRVCAYEVVGEYTGPLVGPTYKSEGVEPSEDYDIYDDEIEEDEDAEEYDYCDDEDELLRVADGNDLREYMLEDGMVLHFDYRTASGERTRRRFIEVKEVKDDRILALEDDRLKPSYLRE